MVNSLTKDFDDFIGKISLNKTTRDDIIAKHTSLTDMIKTDPPEKYDVIKTRISGSYGKHTELNEFDLNKNPDVDIVVIIKSDEDNVEIINNDFLKYLKDKKANVVKEVRQQSNSIGLKYKNIDVDIVLAKENDDGSIRITSDKKKTWTDSNCLKQIDYMSKKSKKYTTFEYRKLIKLFKYLNKEMIENKIKSYTLEMLIHQCVPNNRVDLTLWSAFSETLENIMLITNINDIKDCCDDTRQGYDDKDIDNFEKFQKEINEIYIKSVEALNGDRKKWEEIFGERFPQQPSNKVHNNNYCDKKQTPWCINDRWHY